MKRKEEVYYLTSPDLQRVNEGKEVHMVTNGNRVIIIRKCDCKDCSNGGVE